MGMRTDADSRIMLDIIQQVIRGKYIPTDQDSMVETNTSGRVGSMSCQIIRKNVETLLCSFDQRGRNSELFPYFEEHHGFVSMCDYILFAEDKQNLFVFLIDLKDSTNGPKAQTGIAQTFAEFIVRRITEIRGTAAFPKPVVYRRIGVKTTNAKMTTKGYASLEYDEERYLVLPDFHRFYAQWLMEVPVRGE